MKLVADTTLEELKEKSENFDVLILPGGMEGARTFAEVLYCSIDCVDLSKVEQISPKTYWHI